MRFSATPGTLRQGLGWERLRQTGEPNRLLQFGHFQDRLRRARCFEPQTRAGAWISLRSARTNLMLSEQRLSSSWCSLVVPVMGAIHGCRASGPDSLPHRPPREIDELASLRRQWESSMWACGAAGSALPWHGRGHRFDPDQVHQGIHRLRVAARRLFCFTGPLLIRP